MWNFSLAGNQLEKSVSWNFQGCSVIKCIYPWRCTYIVKYCIDISKSLFVAKDDDVRNEVSGHPWLRLVHDMEYGVPLPMSNENTINKPPNNGLVSWTSRVCTLNSTEYSVHPTRVDFWGVSGQCFTFLIGYDS